MNTDTTNYWWLNTNPNDWRVREYEVGFDDTEKTRADDGKPPAVYSNFAKVKIGDLMIGYETTPTRKVLAIYRATKGIHIDKKDGECIRFCIEKFVDKPIGWDDIKTHPVLVHSKMVRTSNRGSLFSLTLEEYHAIIAMVSN